MIRRDDQQVFLNISDDEAGESFYILQPWKAKGSDQAWEMVSCCRRSERRLLHSHSLVSLALLAIKHFST